MVMNELDMKLYHAVTATMNAQVAVGYGDPELVKHLKNARNGLLMECAGGVQNHRR